MEIKGTLRADELLTAQRVHLRPRGAPAVAGVLLGMLCAGALWLSFSLLRGSHQTSGSILLACILYLTGLWLVWMPYKVKRSYRQRKDLQREFTLTVSDSGIVVSTANGHVTKTWAEYLKWKEGRSLFLLYLSDRLFQIAPKRFFDDQSEIAAFRATLTSRLGAEGRVRESDRVAGTSAYLHITKVPEGEAPLGVREKWVGLVLPLASAVPRDARIFGVVSGPRSRLARCLALLLGRAELKRGYVVAGVRAIEVLQDASPEAATWWRANAPHLTRSGGHFLFDEDCGHVVVA